MGENVCSPLETGVGVQQIPGIITWFESEVELGLPELKNAPELMI